MELSPLLAILSTVLLAASPASAQTDGNARCERPSQLSCELLTMPQGTVIYDPRPEFAWVCGTTGKGYLQSAYQIIVRKVSASSEDEQQVVWDTGQIDSNQSVDVEYSGEPLEPGGSYEWKVRAWNDQGPASDWSEPQQFQMARQLSESRTSRYPLIKTPHPAEKLVELKKDEYLADFGQDAFGYLVLKLSALQQEQTIEVHFGEKLLRGNIDRHPGGSIRYYATTVQAPAGATEVTVRPPKNKRNTTGDAIRLPSSIGVIAPFRYVEVRGAPSRLNPQNFTQVRIEYPFDETASKFESSDPTLNAVWQLCKYSIRATTFCGIYVDGDRERIPYEADAYINQLSQYGVDREYALARHSHEYLLTHPTWPTEWKQHSVLMAWEDFLYTGNKESLARNYELLKNEKTLLSAELPNGLVDTSAGGFRDIVDWPERERDGFEMRPINTVVNAFHYATLVRLADMASVLGHAEDSDMFARKARVLKEAVNDVLWNPATGTYVDGAGSEHSSLHANLFPLAFGLVPSERIPSVVKFVNSRRMRCSVYAAQYLLEGLYRNDEDRYALKLLTSRGKRSWYNMIRSGSTITMEAWDKTFKPNLDWNHAWGAAPANLIPFYLVGVRPLKPGFEKVLIQPRPGELESFTARVPSIRGPIDVRYLRSDIDCQLEVDIPGNCTANIGIPLADGEIPSQVTRNGDVTKFQVRGKHAWVEDVPPGTHVMTAEFSTASKAG